MSRNANVLAILLLQELTPDKLGFAKSVREVGFGTTKDHSIIVEGCPNLSAVTLFVRAGNKMVLDEVGGSMLGRRHPEHRFSLNAHQEHWVH